MPSIEWIMLYIALGAIVGFLAGLLGLGGGGILVPLLATIFASQGIGGDNTVHLALGTALTCMIISSTASVRTHAVQGTVIWRVVKGMAPGIMLGAFLATQVASYIRSTYIALFFALFMALVAGQMFLNWKPKPSQTPITLKGLLTTGMGIGAISALAAVGGGFLTVVYLGYKNISMKQSIGTSAAIGFPIAITGTIGYIVGGWSNTSEIPYTLGYVYIPAFLAISIASFIAAPYGARCSNSIPETHLKKIFAVISLSLSIKMFISFTSL